MSVRSARGKISAIPTSPTLRQQLSTATNRHRRRCEEQHQERAHVDPCAGGKMPDALLLDHSASLAGAHPADDEDVGDNDVHPHGSPPRDGNSDGHGRRDRRGDSEGHRPQQVPRAGIDEGLREACAEDLGSVTGEVDQVAGASSTG